MTSMFTKTTKTNADITDAVLDATQTKTGLDLFQTCVDLLRRFPLSSHKLVYPCHQGGMAEASWLILMDACYKTDKEKYEDLTEWLESRGAQQTAPSFGRYSNPEMACNA